MSTRAENSFRKHGALLFVARLSFDLTREEDYANNARIRKTNFASATPYHSSRKIKMSTRDDLSIMNAYFRTARNDLISEFRVSRNLDFIALM